MSSFTVVIGIPGAGKTSWINAQVKGLIRREGRRRQELSTAQIGISNRTREKPLTPPDRIPVYTNFDAEYKIGGEIYKPYYITPEYFGLPNDKKPVIPVVPWSIVAFQEVDEEYDSRKHSLAWHVAGLFNRRRHWHLDIFADLHRLMIMDSIIRETVTRVVEVRKCVHEKGFAGKILRTTWYCREFYDIREAQLYVNSDGKEGEYIETEYTYEGNIFKCFNTHDCAKEFEPKEGDDFIYLEQPSRVDITRLPPNLAKFYTKGAKLDNAGTG